MGVGQDFQEHIDMPFFGKIFKGQAAAKFGFAVFTVFCALVVLKMLERLSVQRDDTYQSCAL